MGFTYNLINQNYKIGMLAKYYINLTLILLYLLGRYKGINIYYIDKLF